MLESLENERITIIKAINDILDEQYGVGTAIRNMIAPYFSYKGKKLRPLLTALTYQVVSGKQDFSKAFPLIAAVEIAHNASLLVDDIFDKDLTRRGDKAFFVKYGTFAALAIAYNLSAFVFDLSTRTLNNRVVRVVGEAASDLSSALFKSRYLRSGKWVSQETILDVLKRKTASLFKASSKAAAILADGTEVEISLLEELGESFGIAYQLRDDALAILGSKELLGKPPDSDITNRFQSMITHYARMNATGTDLALLERFYLKGDDTIPVSEIRRILMETGAVDHVINDAKQYKNRALEIAQSFNRNPIAQEKLLTLINIIDFTGI